MTPISTSPAAPTPEELSRMLGETQACWNALQERLRATHGPLTVAWVSSGRKHGWVLRLGKKQRAVVYLKPLDQYFRASLALGTRAMSLVPATPLPDAVRQLIDAAEDAAEGKAVRVDVRGPDDVRIVEQLVGLRLQG